MTFKKHNRQYDLVVLGATGYTGAYACENVTKHLPTTLRWAIAGRSPAKLESVLGHLKALDPDRPLPAVEVLANTPEEVAALAKKTFVLVTAIGPYSVHGEPAFAACAAHGTHYLDATGETPWIARMLGKYAGAARESGAIMIPEVFTIADLMTWLLGKRLLEKGEKVASVEYNWYEMSGSVSGGTLNTFFTQMETFPPQEVTTSQSPFFLSPKPNPRPAPPPHPLPSSGVTTIPYLGGLQTSSPFGPLSKAIVERSWGLLQTLPGSAAAKQVPGYSENFSFAETMRVGSWFEGAMRHWWMKIGVWLLLRLPLLIGLVRRTGFQPGEGVEREKAKEERLEWWAVARGVRPDGGAGGLVRASGRINGSGYELTGLFMAVAAWTLLEDELGIEGEIVTTCFLGQGFADRLEKHGFPIEICTLKE